MNNTAINGAIGFSVLAVGATIDAALGLGGVEWLADLCLTDASDMGEMDMTPREVKPVPLIALSLGITVSAIGLMSIEQKRSLSGRLAPDMAEQAAILSAMLLVATQLGKTSRSELMGFYRIATHHDLEPQIVDLAQERFEDMKDAPPTHIGMEVPKTALGRRRVLAAAMLMARKPEAMTPEVQELIEALVLQIDATLEDAQAVRAALDEWDADCKDVPGVPLFSLLRDRPLALTPA